MSHRQVPNAAAKEISTLANDVIRTKGRARARSRADLGRYEAEKSIWFNTHPASTPEQYQMAINAIKKACGV